MKLPHPPRTYALMKFTSMVAGLLCCAGCLIPTADSEVATWDAGSTGGASGGGSGGGGTSAGGGTAAGGGVGVGGGGGAVLGPQPVEVSDVSILYPLPVSGESTDFIAPTESGSFGQLLPQAFFGTVVGNVGGGIDSDQLSDYASLRVVSLRLDPCSARRHELVCTPEARLVLQSLFQKPATQDDPVAGTAATDGALHVIYDVPDDELVTMLQEILALRAANGNLTLQQLGPHPILAQQGLSGAFAQGLRSIVLAHLGADRIARVTMFNHDNPEIDVWNFRVFNRDTGGGLDGGNIPVVLQPNIQVVGSRAFGGTVAQTGATPYTQQVVPDAVIDLVDFSRPDAGTAAATSVLTPVFEAALRVQNPTAHNAENTDCANCHLAEGAVQIGEGLYRFAPTLAFTHRRDLVHVDQRTSVTNFHAFGYLGRQTSIMSRTANESAVAADALQAKLPVSH